MKVRILSMLLAIVMLVLLVPTTVFAEATPETHSEATPEIYVDTTNIGDLKAGDSVAIPIAVKNNPGLCVAYLEFDIPDVLTYVSVEDKTGADNILWTDPNKVQWEYDTDYTADYTQDGTLFVLNFTVNEGAVAGTYEFGVGLLNGLAANLGDSEGDVTATFVPGTIKIVYETAGLSFVNGSQSMTYDEAKAEAEGAEGATALTKPGDDYHFVGWFSGLADTYKDANGYYVIEPTATVTGIAGTELRPRYQTPPTEGTYNALWIKGTGSYAVNVGASSLDVYVGDSDSAVLSTAIAAANGARTKLVKDMNLASTKVTPSVAMNLDMNGCKILAGATRIISPSASTTGNVIESSRMGGAFGSKSQYIYGDAAISAQFDLIRDIDFIGSKSSQAIYLASATKIENCNFEGYIQFVGKAGTTLIDNCTIDTGSFLITGVQKGAVVTITNTTMNSTGTNPLFVGTADTPGATYGVGSVVLGAGNSVVATSATALFRYLNPAKFVDYTSTYQIKPGGTLTNVLNSVDAKVECSDASLTPIVDGTGKVVFGDPCTVTYKKDDGSIETKTGLKGGNADLSFTYQIGNGKEYKLLGWSTDPNATEPMTEIPLSGDITLYAVKARKGVMIGSDNNDYESGNVITTYKHGSNANAFIVYNADRLDELDGLTLFGYNSYIKLVFSAEALDAIASQINGESKDISVVLYRSTSGLSDGAKVKGQIALTYKASNEAAEQAITIPEGVEVQLRVDSQSSIGNNKKFAAYDVANPDTELATEFEIVSSYYWAYFRMPANGTFEVKALPNAYVGEDQMVGNPSFTLKNGDTDLIVENATKIGDLNSLNVSNDSAGIEVTFSAAALDSIAEKVSAGSLLTIRVVSATPSEGAVARAELFVLDSNGNPVDFTGAVEINITFTYEDGKIYRAYYIPENGDPVGFRTTFNVVNASYKTTTATFTTTHFSAFEIRETTVAEGYTAGLDIAVDEIRAGGNTVNVTIDVTHSAAGAVLNAGEIVITFDSTLLTFNEAASTLPENATCKVDGNTLTIVFYGADLVMPYAITLAFTTVDSVDVETATQITLTSAKFTDSVNAVENDLETATIAVASDTVTIKYEMVSVTLPTDKDATGTTDVPKNSDYTFTINKDEHYTYGVTATMGGNTVTVKDNGDGTYTIEDVTGEIVITIEKTANQYDVTFEGEEPAANNGDKATHDTDYSFTLPTIAQHQVSYTITIGGNAYTGAIANGNVITIPGSDITGAIVVTISKTQTEFNVTLNGSDAGWTTDNGDQNVALGETITVTITPAPGYSYELTATQLNGDALTVTQNGNVYTISGFTSDITIDITKTLVGDVEVYEYITLTGGKTMFLVTYVNNALGNTDIPHYGNAAMYWSAEYNAYCYLVIDTALTAEQAKANIAVKAGTKTAIVYETNVNGSTETDAADAQLVYNMYTAEYNDFGTVGVDKFLGADLNGDKKIDVKDAVVIINDILGIQETEAN